ncbi:SusC/RagA family TonB-linked outer membrane protein [Parapedobacter koreensis]|nr:SusC/RagA family TonB-linked outer membrane protein [Parapedobacter koreensis]
MKLAIFLTFAFAFHAIAESKAQKITLSARNISLREAMKEIQKQQGYSFLFRGDDIADTRVDVQLIEVDFADAMRQILDKRGLDWSLEDGIVTIMAKSLPRSDQFASPHSLPQLQRTITGQVTDEQGSLLAGVTVTVKGTPVAVTTDDSGHYQVAIPTNGNTLVFTMVGFETLERSIVDQTVIDVSMSASISDLDEVVVVGYGTQRKGDLTGSISSVTAKELGDRVATDLGSLLQGKVPGLDVSQGAIRVRGVTTLNNSNPLIIVDGIWGGAYNPNNVERIEVLKDASSTAIYGARGANGVILITTKSGHPGQLNVTANVFNGLNFFPKKWDLLNASQYVDFASDAVLNSGGTLPENLTNPESRIDVTDWQDEMYKTGHQVEVNLGFSGGTEKGIYALFAGYRHNDGIMLGSEASNNFFLQGKNEFRLTKWFKGGLNLSIDYGRFKSGWVFGSEIYQGLPYIPVYDPDNSNGLGYGDSNTQLDGTNSSNAVAFANFHQNDRNYINVQPALWAEVSPIKGLVYRFQASAGINYGEGSQWNPDYVMGGGVQSFTSKLIKGSSYALSPLIENTLTYATVLQNHEFSIMAGNTWQNLGSNGGLEAVGSLYDNYNVKNLLYATTAQITQHTYNKWAYLSYFGRLNYQLNNKYLFTVNMRADGSPKFAPVNRWGYFPSVAVGWKMHEEEWFKQLAIFDQFKLRASWGRSGNDAIGDFMYLSKVWNNNVVYPLGVNGDRATGATVITNSAGDIKWETTESVSAGLDVVLLKGKLSATAEYFDKDTRDILFSVPRPPSMGYGGNNDSGDPVVNAASVNNTGLEFNVGYQDQVNAFRYDISANYTYVHNKVVSLGAGQPYMYSSDYAGGGSQAYARTDIGYSIGYFYGFQADGIFMNQEELDVANQLAQSKGQAYFQGSETRPGDVRYKDLDGDGVIS